VFLFEPDRTQFDLSWRMFGIPVRIHPMFWLLCLVLGQNLLRDSFAAFFLFVGCVLVSLLVHEMGHVLMGLYFGRSSYIVLYGFGGVAVSNRELPSRGQRIAVSLAGPAAGLVLFGLVWLFQKEALPALDPNGEKPLLWDVVYWLYLINLVWNLLNLVPIWPLDGGKISREILTGLLPRNGLQVSLGISFLLASLLAIQALSAYYGGPYIPFLYTLRGPINALLFGVLAFQSFQLLQQAQRPPWREDWPGRWDRR
jgi:Zn-dependent protease